MGSLEFIKSIRTKLFIFFFFMGGVPFVTLIIVGALNSKAELEEAARRISLTRSLMISEHVTELVERNMAVLHSLALMPEVINFVQSGGEAYRGRVETICRETNAIFKDENLLAVTDRTGQQIFRTDGSTLVNLTKREHFQEAMKGREYVTDLLASMSTGKMIIVMAAPVLNLAGEPVGMVQRNFDLTALQEFVLMLDDSQTSIIIMDRDGRVIANSDELEGVGSEYSIDNTYRALLDKVYNSNGVLDWNIEGVECMSTYSRNLHTGWMIVTIWPYELIWAQVYEKIFYGTLLGTFLLVAIGGLAWIFSSTISAPIVKMTDAVGKIAAGADVEEVSVEVSTNDELGQMAAAFNKIRTERERLVEDLDKVQVERDDFKLASELDKLTDLFNKTTMEKLCEMKLRTFNENNLPNVYIAFYIIDLDHFKEVNDLLGHQFGDKVLVEFANGLRKVFRTNDCIGRFGGDEFVAIIDNLPQLEVVRRKAEQIRNLAFNLTVEGKTKFVTASIGIAIAPYEGRDYETLFRVADEAVYWVKNNGKNNFYCKHLAENDD
ncbi:MAG: diguanylate cyclase [Selenomonadaceae bacterium]|nr:diguanylate cyclase [Selenomonadaceae bacterium]